MCKIYILSDIQDPGSSEKVTLDGAKKFLSHLWLESPSHTEEEINAFVDEIYAADFKKLKCSPALIMILLRSKRKTY